MVYTVTLNPAIDYVMHTDSLKMGSVNRTTAEQIYFGGKGINVSTVLTRLGVKTRALGFVAGFTGRAIEQGIGRLGVESDFIHLQSGLSRINVKIKSVEETELNGQGPQINQGDIEMLLQKIDKIGDEDMLVLAGSVPPSLPPDIYEIILKRLADKRTKTVVDASGTLLTNTLKYKPFLIKPNIHELGEIFGVRLDTNEQVIEYAKRLRQSGAANVLVSMAQNGAILIDEHGKTHICGVCSGSVKSSVGAGDSMVAGFIAGCTGGNYDHALKLATACGGATAFSDELGQREDILRLLKQLVEE